MEVELIGGPRDGEISYAPDGIDCIRFNRIPPEASLNPWGIIPADSMMEYKTYEYVFWRVKDCSWKVQFIFSELKDKL